MVVVHDSEATLGVASHGVGVKGSSGARFMEGLLLGGFVLGLSTWMSNPPLKYFSARKTPISPWESKGRGFGGVEVDMVEV